MKKVTAETGTRIQKAFSERLSFARKLSGLTQQELAERVCLSKQTILRYERGESVPQFDTAVAIARELDISLDCLCGRSC